MTKTIPSTDIRFIPASQLVLSPFNVRKTGGEHRIDELACSIEAHGIVQNLSVHACPKKGRKPHEPFAVFAGGRRWRALQRLLDEKRIPENFPVPCAIRPVEEAIELSLAENAHEPMHPADEFEAFCALIDSGRSIEDVAARFGVESIVVKRRLKLARVAPEFLNLYRQGEISLEHLFALALSDDHERQRQVWNGLRDYNRQPEAIREAITENEMALDSPVARFVGFDNYERAGGGIRRDLFGGNDSGFALDVALMRKLAQERLEQAANELRADGAAFVEVIPELEYGALNSYGRVAMVAREPTPDEQQALDAIRREKGEIEKAIEDAERAEDEGALEQYSERLFEIEEKEDELQDQMRVPDPLQAARAGAVVTIDHAGHLKIERGLLKPEDAKRFKSARRAKDAAKKPISGQSAALTRRLTAHRTLALQATLVERPDVALAAITHRLALRVFYPLAGSGDDSLEIHAKDAELKSHADDLERSHAHAALRERTEVLRSQLPSEASALLGWLLAQSQETVLAVLAFCVATSVNGVQSSEGPSPIDGLAKAAQLDMTRWWSATAESYFLSLPKAKVLEIVRSAVSAEAATPLEKLKRGPMAAAAEHCLSGRGWLPECMRGIAA